MRFPVFLLAAFGLLSLPQCEGTTGPLLRLPEDAAGGATLEPAENPGAGAPEAGGSTSDSSWSLPDPDASFQIQLSDELDTTVDAELYVVDLHSPTNSEFEQLLASGAFVACYFSAGSFEPWRPDADDFPESVKGSALPNYPDEQWLDVRSDTVLARMTERMSRAKERGCAGVYPSLVRPEPGELDFELNDIDFAVYARALAEAAHELELAAFFAGGTAFETDAAAFDVTLVFGCVAAQSCDAWESYASGGGLVYRVEYDETSTPEQACPTSNDPPWPTIVKAPDLGAERLACPTL